MSSWLLCHLCQLCFVKYLGHSKNDRQRVCSRKKTGIRCPAHIVAITQQDNTVEELKFFAQRLHLARFLRPAPLSGWYG